MRGSISVIVTDQSIVVPDTGSFSNGILGLGEMKTISILSLVILALVSIAAIIFINSKRNKNSAGANKKEKKLNTIIKSTLLVSGISGFFLSSLIVGVSSRAIEDLESEIEDTVIYVVRNGEENTFGSSSTEITITEDSLYGYDLLINGGGVLTLEGGTDTISLVESYGDALTSNTYGVTMKNDDLAPSDGIWNPISDQDPFFTKSEIKPYEAGDKITVNYGVYVSADLPAGTYIGEVEYDLEKRTCDFSFNSNHEGAGAMAGTVTCGDEIDVPAGPTRAGYKFDGWFTDPTGGTEVSGTIEIVNDVIYYAHWTEKYTIEFVSNGSVISTKDVLAGNPVGELPSVTHPNNYIFDGWYTEATGGNLINAETYPTGSTSYYAHWINEMQDFASLSQDRMNSILASMPEEDQYQLEDVRDNKIYYISRLKDGNVWMTQNLDFNIDSAETYDSTNTDLTDYTSDFYQNGYSYDSNTGIITWDPADSANTSSNLSDWVNSTQYPYSYAGDGSTVDNSQNGRGFTGNYYNWTAAIASNDSGDNGASGRNKTANNSICPAGWRLPSAGSENNVGFSEYGALLDATVNMYSWTVTDVPVTGGTLRRYNVPSGFNWDNILKDSIYLKASGFINAGQVTDGSSGFYTTSNTSNRTTANAFFLNMGSDQISPADNGQQRHIGTSVRCVLRQN